MDYKWCTVYRTLLSSVKIVLMLKPPQKRQNPGSRVVKKPGSYTKTREDN